MKLHGLEIEKICKALGEAYLSYDLLKQMVRFKLDENLESITGKGELSTVIFNLVVWAESKGKGKLQRLIRCAYEENQENISLKELYKKHCDFMEKVSVISYEHWREIKLILSKIDYDLLEQTCRETLKGKTKNIEDHFPRIICFKNLDALKEILLEQCPDINHVPTILEFTERLTNNKQIPKTYRRKIKKWLEMVAKEKNIKLPTYQDQETQLFSIKANSYLEIVIEKYPGLPDHFKIESELIPNYQEGEQKPDSELLSPNKGFGFFIKPLEDIKDAIYEFIKIAKLKLIKEYKYSNYNLTIDLFLPLEYLGQHFDLEEIPAGLNKYKPIGYQHRLVTRCLERYLINEDTCWGEFFNKFEQKWNFLQDFLKNNPIETDFQDKFLYLENDEIAEIHQWDEFSKAIEWEDSPKLAINVTGNLSGNECQKKFFECLLRGGIPISLWHSSSQLNCIEVREQFKQFLNSDTLQDMSKLLTKILLIRRDAHNKHEQVALGYHLGFLCEHGFRIPSILNPYQGGDSLEGYD